MPTSSPIATAALAATLLASLPGCSPASQGASSLLHPDRSGPGPAPSQRHEDFVFAGEGGVTLRGWRFPASGPPRGVTVVWLHGFGDSRRSGAWMVAQLAPLGFDVLAWDHRAHGASGGDACTWGVLERRDVSRALDAAGVRRAVLLGHSMGGAIALQAAAEDPRVEAVVAVAAPSELRGFMRERAPWFATDAQVREALALAGRQGGFAPEEASALRAADRVRVPVLLLHGASDSRVLPAHAHRLAAALAGPTELRLLDGAGHGDVTARAWPAMHRWVLERFAP